MLKFNTARDYQQTISSNADEHKKSGIDFLFKAFQCLKTASLDVLTSQVTNVWNTSKP